ncbi:hypothetical protein YC2023_033468 [Brassica napus]
MCRVACTPAMKKAIWTWSCPITFEVLLDTPPGSPKNCPEAKGGSVRVQISLSKFVSFYMLKPRFCPSRDQSSPV